jgi:hypothetical protein
MPTVPWRVGVVPHWPATSDMASSTRVDTTVALVAKCVQVFPPGPHGPRSRCLDGCGERTGAG